MYVVGQFWTVSGFLNSMPKKELGSLTHPFSAACVCAGEREGAFFGSACANTPVETSAVATKANLIDELK